MPLLQSPVTAHCLPLSPLLPSLLGHTCPRVCCRTNWNHNKRLRACALARIKWIFGERFKYAEPSEGGYHGDKSGACHPDQWVAQALHARRTGDYSQWTGLLTWPDSYQLGRVRTLPATGRETHRARPSLCSLARILSLSHFSFRKIRRARPTMACR